MLALTAIAIGCRRKPAVPEATYRQAVTAFYVSLAAMQTSQDVLARNELERVLQTSAASSDLEFSRDGARLAGTSIDERGFAVRIWDWPAGNELLKLRDSGLRIALSPDRRLVATVRPRQPVPFVHVWALDPELLLEIARDRVTRKLTDEECARYLLRPCTGESG